MENIIKGRVLKFGDNVNTDVIAPGRWKREGLDVLRLHTMEAIRTDFYKDVEPGNIIVGGNNFGCGSHRDEATTIMNKLGISAIVCDSLARLYFRNCIAYGIPVFSASGISKMVEEGQELKIMMGEEKVVIENTATGEQVTAPPIPETMIGVLKAGGVFPLLKQRLVPENKD